MIIYPDIEISDGKCVNLQRGLKEDPVVYDITPLDAARKFIAAGAEWLHVLDLDGVFQHGHDNSDAIVGIIDAVDVPVQVAGGIRTMHDVNWWFDHGAARIVLGTVAVTDYALVVEASNRYPGAVVVSIDTKEGHVMIDGWQTQTSFGAVELARELQNSGVAAIVHTDLDRFVNDIETNMALTTELGMELSIPVISTGTVRSLDDLATLKHLPNIEGAVVGRALFAEIFTLEEALQVAAQPDTNPERELGDEPVDSASKQGVKVYLAASSATQSMRWWNRELSDSVAYENPYVEIYLPQDHRQDDDAAPRNLEELDGCDVVVAVLDGTEYGSWPGFECGYAHAKGKKVIGVLGDEFARDPARVGASIADLCAATIIYNMDDDVHQTIAYLARELKDELLSPS